MMRSVSSLKLGQSMVTGILDKLEETETAHEVMQVEEFVRRNRAAGGSKFGFFYQGTYFGKPVVTLSEEDLHLVADIQDEIKEYQAGIRQKHLDFQKIKQGVAVLFRYAGTPEKAMPYMPAFMVTEFFPSLRSLHDGLDPLPLPEDGTGRRQTFQDAIDLIYKYLANRILY